MRNATNNMAGSRKRSPRWLISLFALLAVLLVSLGILTFLYRHTIRQALQGSTNRPSQSGPVASTSATPVAQPAGMTAADSGLISRGVPAFSTPSSTPPSSGNDNNYDTTWRSQGTPAWLAYDLSGVPAAEREKVLLVWYNPSGNYDHTLIKTYAYNNLRDYTIEVNPAPGRGNAPGSGWVVRARVQGNTYHSRQHVIDMKGYNWMRINVTAADGAPENMDASIKMDVYTAQKALADDWIFYGDSITEGSMNQYSLGDVPGFATLINERLPGHFPVQEGGGTGYLTSADGARYIATWLSIFPGKYVGLSYGTNDAFLGCNANAYYNNYVTMVQAVLKAGKIPVVPSMPWSRTPVVQNCGPAFVSQIDALYQAFPQIIHGPDLWTFFKTHQDFISQDNIHPNQQGFAAYRKLWANQMLSVVYKVS